MLISIDPSTNLCGVAFTVLEGKNVVCKRTRLIQAYSAVRHSEEEREIEKKWGRRYLQIKRIVDEINKEIDAIDQGGSIAMMAIEAPFYMPGKPGAFAPLVEAIFAIKSLVAAPRGIPIMMFEPLLVKSIFSRKSNASKDEMRKALRVFSGTSEILIEEHLIDSISEHEVDAIAVGYSYWFEHIKALHAQGDSQ